MRGKVSGKMSESIDYRRGIEEAERRLSEAFEKWLEKQTPARLKEIIRDIWYNYKGARMFLLPYEEILEESK
jgi:hypothetical protein